jgi:tetratricopeptide (TPR) repeat protein
MNRRKQMPTIAFLLIFGGLSWSAFKFDVDANAATYTATVNYNKAVDAYNAQDWQRSRQEYRVVLGTEIHDAQAYEGLLNCCVKLELWGEVAFAAEHLLRMNPEQINDYAYDYGTALYHLGRYNEAVPFLKRALQVADIPSKPFAPKRRINSIELI